ncbi:MAG: PKD domain-containing protein [Planctomycetes bacterium]|nr:PKD domain-containing protein [Planctomycetota bacterium]
MNRYRFLFGGAGLLGLCALVLTAGCGGGDQGLGVSNDPPDVDFTCDYGGGDAPVTVTYTAAATDSDGIQNYEWDTDYDGTFNVTASGGALTQQIIDYSGGGTFTVAVIVTDTKGGATFRQISITVTGNQAPEADLDVTPSSGPATTVFAFDASGSTDDSAITLYEWDWDYTGTFNADESGASPTNTHQYAANGVYTAAVQVTDDNMPTAATDIATVTVTVQDAPANNDPIIDTHTATPDVLITVPGSVDFEITYHDPDMDTCTVQWDTDYNWSTFQPETAYDGDTSITLDFNAPGTYYIQVQVNDGNGGIASYTYTYVVGQVNADFYITNAAGSQVYSFGLPASANGVPLQKDPRDTDPSLYYHWDTAEWAFYMASEDHPAVYVVPLGDTVYFQDATTPAGTHTYDWDFGDTVGGSTDQNPNYTYGAAGIYYVQLNLNSGMANWDYHSAVVVVYDSSTQGVVTHTMDEQSDGSGPDHMAPIAGADIGFMSPTTPAVTTNVCVTYTNYGGMPTYTILKSDFTTWADPVPGGATIAKVWVVLPVARANSIGDDDEINVYRITTDWQHNTVVWDDIIGTGQTIDTATNLDRDAGDPAASAVYSSTLHQLDGFTNYPMPYPVYYLDITNIFNDWRNATYSNQGILIAIDDINGRNGSVNFMNAGRCSSEYSRWFEPVIVVLYNN